MPKTRLQLRESMIEKGEMARRSTDYFEQRDLRSTSSRSKPPTQVGANLGIVEKPLPAYMSDKRLAKLASDPIASIKYGKQIQEFGKSAELQRRIEQRSQAITIENRNLERIENRIRNIVIEDDDEYENYFDTPQYQEQIQSFDISDKLERANRECRLAEIHNINKVLFHSEDLVTADVKAPRKTKEQEEDDWLFKHDSSF